MKNRIVLFLIFTCFCLILTGCSKKDDNSNTSNNQNTTQTENNGVEVRQAAKDEINSKYKVMLKTVTVGFYGKLLNFQVVIANDTNEDIEFDCSKFSIKTQNQEVLKVDGTVSTIKANSNYNQLTCPINDDRRFGVGSLVYAYYDTISLGPGEVINLL